MYLLFIITIWDSIYYEWKITKTDPLKHKEKEEIKVISCIFLQSQFYFTSSD